MKIRLPSLLTNNSGNQGIEKKPSDDISCSSDGSTGNRSVRSFLSSKSMSRSRLRQRQRSYREEKPPTIIPKPSTSTTPSPQKQESPTKKILKRLQKSFAASSSSSSSSSSVVPNSKGGGKFQPQSFDSDNNSDHEKENIIPMVAPNAEFELQVPIVIDSTIVSIAEKAVALNFPSSYIRPVPIQREDIPFQTVLLRTHGSTSEYKTLARTPTHNEPQIQRSSEKCDRRASSEIGIGSPNITTPIAQQNANPMTNKRGKVLVIEKAEDEIDCGQDGDQVDNHSPASNSHSNSLLPPLADDEDEGSQKLLLPSTIDPTNAIAKVGSEKLGNESSITPQRPLAKIARPETIPITTDIPMTIAHPPPPNEMNACVSSPLSRQSLDSSCDSSLSMARSSLIFNSNDGSNDHIAFLTKSTFKPPREVVTITSGPLLPKAPGLTPGRRRKQSHQKQNQSQSKNKTATKPDQVVGNRKPQHFLPQERNNNETSELELELEHEHEEEDVAKKTAEELAVRLLKDAEKLRGETEKYASKNRRLKAKLQILKAQQDEHMVHRGRLIKACLYTAPVFVICGGLDTFLATILLVWVLVEVDGYLDGSEGNDGDDGEDEDYDSDRNGHSDSEREDDCDSDDGFGDDGSSMSL